MVIKFTTTTERLNVTIETETVCNHVHVSHTIKFMYVFIITDKAKLVGEEVKGVGVMKDEELKLEEIETSHTLGG